MFILSRLLTYAAQQINRLLVHAMSINSLGMIEP
jgi:hypothetical protein